MRFTPDPRPPTPDPRRLGLRVLLVSTFFAWGGFFLVIPMISVHYVDQLGWSAASIGLVLAARQFAVDYGIRGVGPAGRGLGVPAQPPDR